jgi:hypothetical protein
MSTCNAITCRVNAIFSDKTLSASFIFFCNDSVSDFRSVPLSVEETL